ncbi:TPA: GHKL domain-containing protein [Candidatus Poribacteria bacterium]|nr:GHKL domain-containing protein [Candidatus Poribacteria bacterium]
MRSQSLASIVINSNVVKLNSCVTKCWYRNAENREVLEGKNEALTESYENLKQAQEQLIQTEKMASLGSLTAGIAHEIRNPLNFVNNFAELSSELTQELLEELQDQKEKIDSDSLEEIEDILDNLEQNLSRIDQHGKRADSIVNGMLLHSRGVSGEHALTDLNALLEEYVNLAYHGLRAQDTNFNITIERDYDESLEMVDVVPQDISRVFLNMLNNACYAAHQRVQEAEEGFTPTLWVSTKDVSDQVQIGIKDNGAGIPEEILNKIFEPFMTTKPSGSGTGLGLSISYEIIVDEHQGQIDVDTQEGEYTEFIITLPKSSEPDSD